VTSQRKGVIDTTVLQKANAPLIKPPKERSCFKKRLELLMAIEQGNLIVLISKQLIAEYRRQVREPRNDYVRAFFEILASNRAVRNWKKPWSGDKAKARKCRFPREDDHVLRTAIDPDDSTTIFSEENDMVAADSCIHRVFGVHIVNPCKV
jgi:hypothetical protein